MASKFELSNTTPAAPGGRVNVQWLSDSSGNVSGNVAAASSLPLSKNIFTPTPLMQASTGWTGYSMIIYLSGPFMLLSANTWKIGMWVQATPIHVGNIVVKRTAVASMTVIDTTSIKVGGSSAFSLSVGETLSDTINLAIDDTHDYYVIAYFDSAAGNVGQAPTGLYYADPSGDQTGASSMSIFWGAIYRPTFFSRAIWVS